LADDDVTPRGDAYRNLRWDKLAEFAKDAKPGELVGGTTGSSMMDVC
jgi:hypothetical protein